MVEGGRIDQGHHEGWAQRALNETIAFDDNNIHVLSYINLPFFYDRDIARK